VSLPQLLTTPSGIVTVVCECLALAAMLPFVIIELGSLQAYAGGWLSLWNALDVLTYSLQVRQLRHLNKVLAIIMRMVCSITHSCLLASAGCAHILSAGEAAAGLRGVLIGRHMV
jgi:hypothetical protein